MSMVEDFYAAVRTGDRRTARRIAKNLRRNASHHAEQVRWGKWLRALRRGHRVLIKTHPVEFIVGEDLCDLEAIRTATPEDFNPREAEPE